MSTHYNNPLVNRCLLLFVLLLLPVVHGCGKKAETTNIKAVGKFVSSFKNIFEAAEKGYVNDIEYFLEQGATVNDKDPYGAPLIHVAARFNSDVDVMKYLIEKGADVNAKFFDGMTTPLFFAVVFNSNIEVAKILIDKGADVNAKDILGQTPLLCAASLSDSNIDVLKYLIDKGADVNAKDIGSQTPLHYAAQSPNPNIETLKYLIEKGADVNAKDKRGQTPLDFVGPNKEKEAILREAGGKRGEDLP